MRAITVQRQVEMLVDRFPQFLRSFERYHPFRRCGQLSYHLQTITKRRELGSARKAIDDDDFVSHLYLTLRAWGIGIRGSRLKPLAEFKKELRTKREEIAALDGLLIEDLRNATTTAEQLWQLINSLKIVDNKARIVAGSKTLHHILPDLVVPIDRAYTQTFFRWHNPYFQNQQPTCFLAAFGAFVEIAQQTKPSRFIEKGWNSSSSKVIDNAIIGSLCENRQSLDP